MTGALIMWEEAYEPAAQHARRSGIDFILDPMWAPVAPSLSEHVDGIRQCVFNKPRNLNDPLHIQNLVADPENQDSVEEDEEL